MKAVAKHCPLLIRRKRNGKRKKTTWEASFDNLIRRESFTINRKRKQKMASKGFLCEDKRNSPIAASSSTCQQCKGKALSHW